MKRADLKDVVFERGRHWVRRLDKGYEVYRADATHSVRVAQIGFAGDEGLARAIKEVERREAA